MQRILLASATLSVFVASAVWAQPAAEPPPAPREFRAAWVATVNNIDWPSKKGLPGDQQQQEIIAILDKAVELKLNCLIVQIRTSADALYPSKFEPWSAYLSGTQGQPPAPLYDPLKMWIEEGHKRGIEIHAWFNPYRAGLQGVEPTKTHISQRRPELVFKYGTFLWLDPANVEAAKHSLAVFNDVVRRYDVDGIHIDDYFYPYPIESPDKKGELPFPDDATWERYKRTNRPRLDPTTEPAVAEQRARDEWRRQHVNAFVRELNSSTKKIKPHVKFGISPFGIGRPGTAPGISGFDQYTKLYADAALWLREGWCDYFTPQLYWPIKQKQQSFPVLLEYWRSENVKQRHIWPGMFTSQIGNRPRPSTQPTTTSGAQQALDGPTTAPASQPAPRPWLWSTEEIPDQIDITRVGTDSPGHVHFSMKALMRDTIGVSTLLKERTYQHDALVPATPWLDNKAPPKPTVSIEDKDGKAILTLRAGRGEAARVFAIWKKTPDGWQFQTVPGQWKAVEIAPDVSEVVVTAVDRSGNESERVKARR